MTTVIKSALAEVKPRNALYTTGKELRLVHAQIEKKADTANGAVFVLASGLPLSARIHRITFPKGTPALTGLTNVDIGFYRKSDDTVLKADALVKAKSFATALTNIDIVGDGVTEFDNTATIGELLGLGTDQTPAEGVNLCVTVNEAGNATGVLDMDILIEQW